MSDLFSSKNEGVFQLEETSTNISAKTHAVIAFVTRDLDLWPFDPNINRFSGLIVEQFYVTFGDPSCIRYWYNVWK